MSPDESAFEAALADLPVVAILRATTPAHLADAAEVLAEEGIRAIEFPLTTPGVLSAVTEAATRLGDSVVVGAGTVLDAGDARRAIDAGARLLVSPALCPDALRHGRAHGLPVLPGVSTPTEALHAVALGARLLKLFPADALGPRYLASLTVPLPSLRLVPVGGVRLADVGPWLAAGAAALGIGAPLHADTLETGDLGALRVSARAWIAAVRRAQAPA
ncbi:bifunctional 4-hydroxy-2-oxoglutarate aldolase/2-dehydro-3-deoxy-phosphogluconate aldolase [Streptomyces sp. NPDC047028]|uniref:bifunctional 4-hydroxy-2-oxoglutarate aldolase/2-dehydro-3-deoxy-phosphogluconate aldolase n=1 Tax=Streptomyces sp. NPDC047028 TaxID=3155793 RepID=UPI0033FE1741